MGDMRSMFRSAYAFNQDISAWNTEQVTDMGWMFYKAYAFNQDISAWNTEQVTSMLTMFTYAASFKQNICPWVTNNPRFPNNIDTDDMFYDSGCPNTNEPTNLNACFTC